MLGAYGGGGKSGEEQEVNEDVLEELKLLYDDVDEKMLEDAARCDNVDEALERLSKLQEPGPKGGDPPPKPKDPREGFNKLKGLMPSLDDDQLRAVVAGFEGDVDAACRVAAEEKSLIDRMLEISGTIEDVRREIQERKKTEDDDVDSAPIDLTGLRFDELSKRLVFGPAAFGPLQRKLGSIQSGRISNIQSQVPGIVAASCPDAASKRTTRGDSTVSDAMGVCCTSGLHTLGGSGSSVNSQVVPAIQFIFSQIAELPAKDSKRVHFIGRLVDAFQDCQAVQAREILKMYAELTSQAQTLETQLKFALISEKERALGSYITNTHNGCDLDHTSVQPYQQRAHLLSGYVSMIGEDFGFDEAAVLAASHDRFVDAAKREIGSVDKANLITKLRQGMMVKDWLQSLLADINNQSTGAVRGIDRDMIFSWVQQNMTVEKARDVFYSEERADEFLDQNPKEPTEENKYQPFLSYRMLVEMLLAMKMVQVSAAYRLFQR